MNERMGIPKGFDFIQAEDIPQIVTWALAEAKRTGSPLYGKLDWAGYYLLRGKMRRD